MANGPMRSQTALNGSMAGAWALAGMGLGFLARAPNIMGHVPISREATLDFPARTKPFYGSKSFCIQVYCFGAQVVARYWEVQVEIGENVQGWVFWTWKVEFTIILCSHFR